MMDIRRNTKSTRLGALCALLLVGSFILFAQDSRPPSDKDQIVTLMKKLSDHSANAEDVIDPKLDNEDRKKSLDHFRDPSYQLTFIPDEEPKIEPDGHAIVPARVHFKNLTSELDTTVDVKFVRRAGTWYFADFNFLGWPLILIVVVIVMPILGIGYAAGALILWNRLRKQDKLKGANLIKFFIPLFWPKLFSETRPPA